MRQLLLITCVGAVLEFFDFAILFLFADVLTRVFIPGEEGSRLWIFAIFALGYLTRPLGGLLFSHFGDRIGRKRLFRLSILLMSLATLGIGLLPGYALVGGLAPALLVLFRVIQGLSVGGELPGSIIYAAEQVPPNQRGLVTASIITSATLGHVLAGAAAMLIAATLTEAEIQQWGWRLPFFAGGALGVAGYVARRHIAETPLFMAIVERGEIAKVPFLALWRHNRRNLLIAIGLVSIAGTVSAFCLFLPSMIAQHLHYSHLSAYGFTTTAMLLLAAGSFCAGVVSDRIGRRRVILTGCAVLLLCLVPAIHCLLDGRFWVLLMLTVLPAALINGCYQAAITELFDTPVRYSGLAISHNLGISLFGGASPYVMELLCGQGFLQAPVLLLGLAAVLAGLSGLYMPCRFRMGLDHAMGKPV